MGKFAAPRGNCSRINYMQRGSSPLSATNKNNSLGFISILFLEVFYCSAEGAGAGASVGARRAVRGWDLPTLGICRCTKVNNETSRQWNSPRSVNLRIHEDTRRPATPDR